MCSIFFFFFLNFSYCDYLYGFLFQEFETLFKDLGGFDGLYKKMLACDFPTAVHLMWIPFSELDLDQRLLVTVRLFRRFLSGLSNYEVVLNTRNWILTTIKDTIDDIMMVIGFPLVEFLIPYPVSLSSYLPFANSGDWF